MPQRRVVASTSVFYYEGGQEDFAELKEFCARMIGTDDVSLNKDGSARYYIGGGDYATLRPGRWLTATEGDVSEDEFRQLFGPIPGWE